MIRTEASAKGCCFCCDGRDDVLDVVFETDGNKGDTFQQRRLPLCVGCRSELHDELTPAASGKERMVVKELNW